MHLVQDLDTRMRKAVLQESRSLSSGLSGNNSNSSNNKSKTKKPQGRCGLLLILLAPMVLLLLILYVLNMYNAMVHYEEQQQQQQQQQQLLRKREADAARIAARDHPPEHVRSTTTTLVLTTVHGPIRITLRPDLSSGSVEYIHRMVESHVCKRCNFYRAEKPGILQGAMVNPAISTNTERGACPLSSAAAESISNHCPKWDPECGCHGPVMTRGSVAWAAGTPGGPDFFINAYPRPANWWGTQHTNFGFIDDPNSLAIVDKIFDLPVSKKGDMTFLNEAIHFDMSLQLE